MNVYKFIINHNVIFKWTKYVYTIYDIIVMVIYCFTISKSKNKFTIILLKINKG